MTATVVRALAWLQWRLLVNALRGGRRRDPLERASRWLDVLTPVVTTALGVPLVLLLVVFGVMAGFLLARGQGGSGTVETIVSVVLLFPMVLVVLRPVFGSARGYLERSDLIRLLPISRVLLFNLEFVRVAADPAVLLFAPALLAVPCGALAAGGGGLAVAAFAAGLVFLLFLISLGGLVVVAAQIFLRDRRRAEAAALILGVGVLAANLAIQFVVERRRPPRGAAARRSERSVPRPDLENRRVPAVLRVLPSSIYATALGEAASGQLLGSAGRIGGIALVAVACYGLAAPLQRRLLETPARSIRRVGTVRPETWALPFVSRATAAVALLQARTTLRTVRGRMGLLMAPLIGGFFVVAFSRATGGTAPGIFGSPLAVIVIVVLVSLQSLAAVSVNQFASDGHGLPLLFLEPLSARTLVRGKALGIGVLQAACLLLAMVPVVVLARPASPSLALAALLGGFATIVILAPVTAALSALFPKQVDLARWGRSSNPHTTAGLVNFLAHGLGAGPFVGAVLLASLVLHRPWLGPVFMVGWLAIAGAVAWLVLPVAERILLSRRENLTLVVLGD